LGIPKDFRLVELWVCSPYLQKLEFCETVAFWLDLENHSTVCDGVRMLSSCQCWIRKRRLPRLPCCGRSSRCRVGMTIDQRSRTGYQ